MTKRRDLKDGSDEAADTVGKQSNLLLSLDSSRIVHGSMLINKEHPENQILSTSDLYIPPRLGRCAQFCTVKTWNIFPPTQWELIRLSGWSSWPESRGTVLPPSLQ